MISATAGVVVLCDANVLYKSLLRDLIVRLGQHGAISPRWTQRIHDEWVSNLLEHRLSLTRARLETTCQRMNAALPHALLVTTEGEQHHLPDPDDQHVLDAAIQAEASLILTFNLSDFPASALPAHLHAVHPDSFLQACLEQQENTVLDALHELRANLKNPPFTPDELLAAMVRAELPAFAAQLQAFRDRF